MSLGLLHMRVYMSNVNLHVGGVVDDGAAAAAAAVDAADVDVANDGENIRVDDDDDDDDDNDDVDNAVGSVVGAVA